MKKIISSYVLCASTLLTMAQTPASTNVAGARYPAIYPDNSVEFRIHAPEANKVQIDLGCKYDMMKDANGNWSVKTKPQGGGIHYYNLIIDGVSVADPASESFYGCSSQTIKINYNKKNNILNLSAIGLNMGEAKQRFHVESMTKPRVVIADYDMVGGKRHHCHNVCKESSFLIKDSKGIAMNMVFRVFNNGVAFRYELPGGGNINGEQTTFSVSPSVKRWLQRYNVATSVFL